MTWTFFNKHKLSQRVVSTAHTPNVQYIQSNVNTYNNTQFHSDIKSVLKTLSGLYGRGLEHLTPHLPPQLLPKCTTHKYILLEKEGDWERDEVGHFLAKKNVLILI